MSDSVRPHRQKPTSLPHPWDSPGKNTGVGCHFLLQCMKVKSESEVPQSCLTLSDPMDYSPPGSSIHGIFQGRVLEWVAISFSGGGKGREMLNKTFTRIFRESIYTVLQEMWVSTSLSAIRKFCQTFPLESPPISWRITPYPEGIT